MGPFVDEYVKHSVAGYMTDDSVFRVRYREGLFLLKNPGGKRLYFHFCRHVSDARDRFVDRGHRVGIIRARMVGIVRESLIKGWASERPGGAHG